MMAKQDLSRFMETARWIFGAVRPWGEFLDLSAFSLPSSDDDANTRFPRNLTRFRGNYAVVLTVLLALTLIARPTPSPLSSPALQLVSFTPWLARSRSQPFFFYAMSLLRCGSQPSRQALCSCFYTRSGEEHRILWRTIWNDGAVGFERQFRIREFRVFFVNFSYCFFSLY